MLLQRRLHVVYNRALISSPFYHFSRCMAYSRHQKKFRILFRKRLKNKEKPVWLLVKHNCCIYHNTVFRLSCLPYASLYEIWRNCSCNKMFRFVYRLLRRNCWGKNKAVQVVICFAENCKFNHYAVSMLGPSRALIFLLPDVQRKLAEDLQILMGDTRLWLAYDSYGRVSN